MLTMKSILFSFQIANHFHVVSLSISLSKIYWVRTLQIWYLKFLPAEIKNQDNWPLNNKQEKYGNNCEVFAHNSISTGPGTRLSSTNKCAEVSKENMQMQEQNDDALFIENPKFSTPKCYILFKKKIHQNINLRKLHFYRSWLWGNFYDLQIFYSVYFLFM